MGYKRKEEDKKRLKKIFEQTGTTRWYSPSGVYYNERKSRYIRYYISSSSHARESYTKFYKRCSNKKVRRYSYQSMGSAPSFYKRIYDYRWEVW